MPAKKRTISIDDLLAGRFDLLVSRHDPKPEPSARPRLATVDGQPFDDSAIREAVEPYLPVDDNAGMRRLYLAECDRLGIDPQVGIDSPLEFALQYISKMDSVDMEAIFNSPEFAPPPGARLPRSRKRKPPTLN